MMDLQRVALVSLLMGACAISSAQGAPKRSMNALGTNAAATVPTEDALDKCPGSSTPTRSYVITIKQTADIYMMSAEIWEYDLDASGNESNGKKHSYDPTGDGKTPTPFTINLGLTDSSDPYHGKHQFARIKVVLDSATKWKFFGSNLGITSNQKEGREMFCENSNNDNVAEFKAIYQKGSGGKHFGSYNINVIVPATSAGTKFIPISIDPEMKNHG